MRGREVFDLKDMRSGRDRRDDAGNVDPDEPWWVRLGVKFGIPTLAAAFLLWFVTLGPGNNAKAQSQALERIEATLQEHAKKMQEDNERRLVYESRETERQIQHEGRMENYARQTCENTARSEARAIRCASVR
jgi:hypothetical protein